MKNKLRAAAGLTALLLLLSPARALAVPVEKIPPVLGAIVVYTPRVAAGGRLVLGADGWARYKVATLLLQFGTDATDQVLAVNLTETGGAGTVKEQYSCEFVVPENTPAGVYTLRFAAMTDAEDNRSRYFLESDMKWTVADAQLLEQFPSFTVLPTPPKLPEAPKPAAPAAPSTPIQNTPPAPVKNPYRKDEVVYANLAHDGSVQQVYVVNSFDRETPAAITDYGDYTALRNLTTNQTLTAQDGAVAIDAPVGKFYYQGTLPHAKLPWMVELAYRLDGQTVTGEALGGATGRMEISLGLKKSPGADAALLDNFALQAAVLLDTGFCKNITASGATMANVGAVRQLNYMLLPGQQKVFTITADVTDFKMAAITIGAIPLKLDIDQPDTTGINDKVGELRDGAIKLDDGAVGLRDGLDELHTGAADLAHGSKKLYGGLRDLRKGSQSLDAGAAGIAGGFAGLKQNGAPLSAALSAMLADPTLPPAQQQLFGGLLAYIQGVDTLGSGYGQIGKGFHDTINGIETLEHAAGGLSNGLQDFSDGIKDTQDGATKLVDGTTELRDSSATMDTQVTDEVNKMLDSYRSKSYLPVSFASPKNGAVENLQFVLKIEEITRPKTTKTAFAEPPAPSLWQRVQNLWK